LTIKEEQDYGNYRKYSAYILRRFVVSVVSATDITAFRVQVADVSY
jgi:hypothetical protein